MNFFILDAFTDKAFAGNPAVVFLVDEFLETSLMQKIAMQFNISQTAFVKKISKSHYTIRWFSPKDETPICGHATFASAYVLFNQNSTTTPQSIIFESLAGSLKATLHDNKEITISFPILNVEACAIPELLLRSLGYVPIDSVYCDDLIYVVVLSRPEDLVRIQPNLDKIAQLPCRAVALTTQNRGFWDSNIDFAMRYFAPKVGIPEDPACGSAHVRLFPLWGEKLQKKELTSYVASSRSGVIKGTYDLEKVHLRASVRPVASGVFFL